jgi:hypothetical protein
VPSPVPKKNIQPILTDLRRPGFNYAKNSKPVVDLSGLPQAADLEIGSRNLVRIFAGIGLVAGVFAVAMITVNILGAKDQIKEHALAIMENFSVSSEALGNLETNEAVRRLEDNQQRLSVVESWFRSQRGETFLGALGSVWPALSRTGSALKNLATLNLDALEASKSLVDLQENGFSYFQTDGEKFLSLLRGIQGNLKNILEVGQELKNSVSDLKNFGSFFSEADKIFGSQYLDKASELSRLDSFVGGLLELFGSDTDRHILLMFQNSAEIRPAGGFLGSYGVLTIKRGQMQNLLVGDIYNPDRLLEAKYIPPEPLQRLTTDWEARDANWFFHFPSSARAVKTLLEESPITKEAGMRFDGVVALNIQVMESLLAFTGPIDLPEYDMVINEDNFLPELQREVETGKDKKPGQNPKRILSVLAPKLLEALSNLDGANKKELIKSLSEHISRKDIMFYSESPTLADFFRDTEVDGSVYDLPNGFWGSYLAVVNANLAGGKSDAFIKEQVSVQVDVGTDGASLVDLAIERYHGGKGEKDPWWRATNQNYLQVFTNLGSNLINLKGNTQRSPYRGSDYADYEYYPELQQIENTRVYSSKNYSWELIAHAKNVFASWFNVAAGETKTLEMRYQNPAPTPAPVEPGAVYTFIFEPQSGVRNSLEISVAAPLGYHWQENNAPVFVYENDDVVGRVFIKLTLEK